MNLFYQPGIPEGIHYLDGDESRHCVKVLRRKVGDTATITDGRGFFYEVTIVKADPNRCAFEVVTRTKAPEKDFFIHLAISPTKNADRIEWFVEKATEIGVDRITLMECKNTERGFIKTERLKKVAVSAMKQSIKAHLPQIGDELVPINDLLENCPEPHRCIAFVDRDNPLHLKDAVPQRGSYCVLIGPEGDFSPEEISAASARGFVKVSLGPSRLRTETAGVMACAVLNILNT